MKEHRIGTKLNQLTQELKTIMEEPRATARLLLGRLFDLTANDVLRLSSDTVLTDDHVEILDEQVRRLKAGEPIAYVIGETYFFDRPFYVGAGVLIPRPDSEIIIEAALESAEEQPVNRILELCLGSACLSVSLLLQLDESGQTVTAKGTEISEAALYFAKRNIARHGLSDRIEIEICDLFPEEEELFDLLIANPPYIDADDMAELDPSVGRYEPHLALAGGADGLEFYRRICQGAARYLKPGAAMILEHGYRQREAIHRIIEACGYYDQVSYRDDYAGRARVIFCRRKVEHE